MKKGKGLNVSDMMTVGGVGKKRQITDTILPNEFYPNHEAIDFYHHYKEDIALMAEMGFKLTVSQFLGQELFLKEQVLSILKGLNTITMLSMNV